RGTGRRAPGGTAGGSPIRGPGQGCGVVGASVSGSAARRGQFSQASAATPPIDVTTRIETGAMSPIANASDELTPIALPISTAASSNVPRLAGPAGIADASAAPDAGRPPWPAV